MRRAPAFVTGEDPAYYAVLGVPSDAPAEVIAAAYRSLMRRYHPDIAGGDAAAEALAKQVNEAFSVLGDPDLRAQYDAVHGYPRVEALELEPEAAPAAPRTRERREDRRARAQAGPPPEEEHGASAMMAFAALVAVLAVVLVGVLVALAREQRAEMAQARTAPAAEELRQR